MASETPKPPREAVDHQDPSIKVRKSLLFEKEQPAAVPVVRPFATYLNTTPAAPLTPAIKATLWTAAVLVGLLFLAALVLGRGRRLPPPRTVGLLRIEAQREGNPPGLVRYMIPGSAAPESAPRRAGNGHARPGTEAEPCPT